MAPYKIFVAAGMKVPNKKFAVELAGMIEMICRKRC